MPRSRSFLHSPKRNVRKAAFHQYYAQYKGHENTLAATLAGSIAARCLLRQCPRLLERAVRALFHDNVPASVYDNLIAAVHKHLPALYHYYDLRRRKMKLPDIHHYDTYVPILSEIGIASHLGSGGEGRRQIARTARQRLLRRAGSRPEQRLVRSLSESRQAKRRVFRPARFDGEPYIMMNYQPEVLDHVFTLAHEAGHSMHSYYSAKHQPFQYYNYTIFVAEVASTFNEQLLSRHMMAKAKSEQERAYLDQSRHRRHPRHDHPPDDVRRVRKNHPRHGRSRRAADGREIQRNLPRACLKLYFGPDFAHRRRAGAGMLPHPALLPGVLRLQIRHRPVGGDCPIASA